MTESDHELYERDEEMKRNLALADQQLKEICAELEQKELDALRAWAEIEVKRKAVNE